MINRNLKIFTILGLLAGCLPSRAQELRSIFPAALRPGFTNEISISGASLDKVTEAWNPATGFVDVSNNTNSTTLLLGLPCPAKTPLGIYPFQVASTKGVSKWSLIMVDDLPTEMLKTEATKKEPAQAVVFPTAIEGTIKSDEACFFRWEAKRGERYSIEVVAQRLGSTLDPVLHILDSEGRALVTTNDEAGLGGDCRINFRAPRDGSYLIKLHDTAFAGGDAYDFRLRLGTFPLATITYPLVIQADKNDVPTLLGPYVDQAALKISSTEGSSYASVESQSSGVGTRSFVPIVQCPGELVLEEEPNNNLDEAKSVGLPVKLNGKIDKPGDIDCFTFASNKGDWVNVTTKTRSLGAPCDLYLELWSGSNLVAESNPASPTEAELSFETKESGEYLLKVKEITGTANDLFVYHCEIKQNIPKVQIASDQNVLDLAPGKSATIKVTAIRTGKAVPIELSIPQFGEGITIENGLIPKDKNETDLKLTLSPHWQPGKILHFRIAARSASDSNHVQYVSTASALKKTFPLMLYPPAGLDDLFTLAIVSE